NPGRTANKAREHLRAILYWAWEQELIGAPPRFPGPRDQRDVAGRHYLTRPEINALYFATHKMGRPRGWDAPIRSAGTGAPPWSPPSAPASIRGPSGGPRRPTSRSCGAR